MDEVVLFEGAGEAEASGALALHSFRVPPGLREIRIRLERVEGGALLSLQILSPIGCRGFVNARTIGAGPEGFTAVAGPAASNGVVPGPATAGEWRLEVSAYGPRRWARYRLYVTGVPAAGEAGAEPAHAGAARGSEPVPDGWWEQVRRPGAGWYRGDFHVHSTASDGRYTVAELPGVVRADGLDFITITDHNTTSAWPGLLDASEVLVLPGMEVTTGAGHANVLGMRHWLPWRVGHGGLTMDAVARLARQQGALFSINHPFLQPWEWQAWDMNPALVDCVEIWNDPGYPGNEEAADAAFRCWDRWLQDGYRITALGGSDAVHMEVGPGYAWPHRIGVPTTCVWAPCLSPAALLESVRRGLVYASAGPGLAFQAKAGGRVAGIGGTLALPAGGAEVVVTLGVQGLTETAALRVLGPAGVLAAGAAGAGEEGLEQRLVLSPGNYIRAEVRRPNGQLLAFTNPIYT